MTEQEYEEFRARCPVCSMSRDQRAGYTDGCPMNCPEVGCPSYDAKRTIASVMDDCRIFGTGAMLMPVDGSAPQHIPFAELSNKLDKTQ